MAFGSEDFNISYVHVTPALLSENATFECVLHLGPAMAEFGSVKSVSVSVYTKYNRYHLENPDTGEVTPTYVDLTRLITPSGDVSVPFDCQVGESKRFSGTFSMANAPAGEFEDFKLLGAIFGFNFETRAGETVTYTTLPISTQDDYCVRILKRRYAPVFKTVGITDNSTAYSIFQRHIQRENDFYSCATAEADPNDTDVMIERYELSVTTGLGTTTYTSADGTVHVGVIDQYGPATFTMTAYDNRNGSVSHTIELDILQYRNPAISVESFLRMTDVLDDQGNITWIEADDGERVSSSGNISITPIDGEVNNAWILTCEYILPGHHYADTALSMRGDDGSATPIAYRFDEDGVTNAETIAFTFTASDRLHSATVTYQAYKAAALLDVEPNGVAVGMRSTGSALEQKFESAWPMFVYNTIHANGGIVDEAGNPIGNSYVSGEHEIGTFLGAPLFRSVFEHGALSAGTHAVGTVPSFGGLVRAFASAQASDGRCFNVDVLVRANGTVNVVLSEAVVSGIVVVEYLHGTVDVYATYPAAAMTAETSQNCRATAYSSYNTSTFAPFRAFDKAVTYSWASRALPSAEQPQWIQLEMPNRLRNITVSITASRNNPANAPKTGRILATNSVDGDTSSGGKSDPAIWHEIGTFANLPSTPSAVIGDIACGNTTGYRYVRIEITEAASTTFVYIGNINITGIVAD